MPATKDVQPTLMRLPRDLHEWLRREAFERREPMLALIIRAIRRLQEEENKTAD